jgi:D-arabinose 1-dehydrogenase-like Zn-dependent alcohol dehydrogenase
MATMRAMVVARPGGPLVMEERAIPEPGTREVRLRVHACGVCGSDAMIMEGFPGLAYPRVPGHEVIGTIEALGPGVEGWTVGMRVGVGWFSGNCGYCSQCRRGAAFACENVQGATGITRDGGYATHMLARASALAAMPAQLDSVESAPLLCAGLTTFNALRHCGAVAGDRVAIQGIGGLGHLGVQYAARQGFRTIAINRGRDKESLARSLGAHDYIDSEQGDVAAALRATGGARAILSTLTSAQAMQSVVGGLAPGGTLMVIGVASALSVNPAELITKSLTVKGWYSGVSAESEDTLRFSQTNGITSMNEIYPFEQAQAAYERMRSGAARFRVVLKIS